MNTKFQTNHTLKELHELIDQMSQIKGQSNSSKESLLQYYLQNVQRASSSDVQDEIQDDSGMINTSGQSAEQAFADLFEKLQLLQAEYDKLESVKRGNMPRPQSEIPQGIRQILKISNSVITIQAWWRKVLALKNMQKSLTNLRSVNPEKFSNMSPEEQSMREFVTQLKAKKLTPESFFRICDSDYTQRVTVASFKEHLKSLNVQLSKAQMSRLIMVLDEDIEGIVTLEEFTNALEAYGVSGEKHKPLDGSVLHHTFQQKCLFKMILALQRKDITYIEVYNACDINDDQRVTLNELRNFIQGLSSDFKVKEIHALIDYLDLDNNGILTREGFLKQLTKGEQVMRQTMTLNKQIAEKRVYQKAQQNNNFMFSQDSFRQSFASPQKVDQDDSFVRFEIEEAGSGDQAMQQPPTQNTRSAKQNQPAKSNMNVSLSKPAIPQNLSPDEVKRQQIIQKMEKEGINLQNFVDSSKRQVVNGCISLGSLLKLFDTSYPSISTSDRSFLVKDCLRERTKIDFVLFEDLLSKYSKNLKPSVTQFFQTVAQNIVKKMGSSPLDSLKQFFRAQSLNELNNIAELEFYQIFQRVAPEGLPQSVFNQAFQTLSLDSDGFAIVQDIITVLASYVSFAGTKLVNTLTSDEMKKIIPDVDLMSPRTRCEKLVKYFAKELAGKNMKAISVYKMADPNNAGSVTATLLEATFKKIFPSLKLEIIQELMQAFRGNKNSEIIKREDFEAVFKDEQVIGNMTTATIQKTPIPAAKEEQKQEQQPDDEMAKWIKKLDDALLKEGVSPAVAFKSADSNRDGSISLEELRETIKRLIPEEELSYLEVLKIVKAFDTDKNKVISEQEFIAKFQKARNTTTINIVETSSQVPFRDTKGLPVKDSNQAGKMTEPKNANSITLLVNQIDEKTNFKRIFSEAPISEEGRIGIPNITRRLKTDVGADGQTLRPSDYMPIIKELDNKNEGSVDTKDVLAFLEKHLLTYSQDCILELKYIANFIEFKMKNRNTKMFFENNSKLRPNTRLMEIEIMTELNKAFGVPLSIGTTIFKKITERNGGKADFTLDDLCAIIDEHRIVKIEPSKPQTESAKMAAEQILINVREKIKAMNKRLYSELQIKFQVLDKQEKQIPYANFYQEFVEENLLVTATECKTLYMHIKNASQGLFNYESLIKFQLVPKPEPPKIAQIPDQINVPQKQPDINNANIQKPKQEEIPAEVNGPVDPKILVKAIEEQIGQPLELVLNDSFQDDQMAVIQFNRKLSQASSNVDRKYLTLLGKLISPQNTGKLTIKEIIGFLKTIPGKYKKEEVIKAIANDISDPVTKSLEECGWLGAETYPKFDYLTVVQSLSKISNFKAVGLFYDLSQGADELQGKIFIQALQVIKPPSQQVEQQNKKTVTFNQPQRNQEKIDKLNQEFLSQYTKISNQAQPALLKLDESIKKNFKSLADTISFFDQTGKSQISIDWFRARLDDLPQSQAISSQEKLLLSFTALDAKLLSDQINLNDFLVILKTPSGYPILLQTLQNIFSKLSGGPPSKQPEPAAEPKIEQINQNLLPQPSELPRVDTFLINQEKQLKKIVEAFKVNMLDNKNREALIKLFESSSNQEIQTDEFFDYVTQNWKNAQIQDEDMNVFEKDCDYTQTGRLRLCDIVKFCSDHSINLNYKGVLKVPQNADNRRETLPGETLTCGKLSYKIVPELDYYRGIPTILTSEEAALVICNKIFNSLDNDAEFFDQDFGPKTKKSQDDIEGSTKAMYFTGDESRTRNPDPNEVEWLRPEEYCKGNPEFINEGASANDVRQGSLGDCWLISALSVLATRDELIRGGIGSMDIKKNFVVNQEIAMNFSNGVYPSIFHVYRLKGLFVFRFFKNFKWLYVIVDDRIPTKEENGGRVPVYGHCKDDHELWVPLIEKAYAKLHGCYEALISGYIDDGLTDLTGFVAEKIQLHQQNKFPAKSLGTIDDFWNFLLKRRSEKCLMGCSRAAKGEQKIELEDDEEVTGVPYGTNSGIIAGHAYGLMDVFEIPDPEMKNQRKTHRILRVRNPWGNTEWAGKWSSDSEELRTFSEQIDKYIESMPDQDEKFDPFEEDGTFLINYRNWRTIYNSMFVCIDFPETWNCVRYYSKWDSNCAGGTPLQYNPDNRKLWAKNPQYCLENKHPGEIEIFISLAQQDQRGCYKNNEPIKYPFNDSIHSMTFSVIHVPFTNPKTPPKLLTMYDHTVTKGAVVKQNKEISLRVKMPQGYIYIVPSTAVAGLEGEFILSIYFSKPKSRVHFHRLDRPTENNFQAIKEESNNANAVPEWKVVECEKRLKYMIVEEDEADQMKVELKKAPVQMKLQAGRKSNFKLSSTKNPVLGVKKKANIVAANK